MAKKALLVGINDYRGVNDLKGCLNDVTNLRHILKTYFGFTNEDIRVLTNDRASKKNILYRLNWMVDKAKPRDFLVFHFSGHGSQIRDRDGDELRDHMDELICPWDMNWDDGFIIDDDLNNIFKKLPENIHLEIFLDCCHSGTGTRNISLGRPAELGPENPALYRYLPPPYDIMCRFEGEEDELKPTRRFKLKNANRLNHVLWAGCMDRQTSADAYINGFYNGAFTYYFCKHVRETGGNINRANLLKRIRNSLQFNLFSQIPQLECENAFKNISVLLPKK